MLTEIEKERKTKRKHKKCGEARTASSVAEFAPSSIFSLSLSLSCRLYSRSFSLSAPLPQMSGLVGRTVLATAARCQDAPGGLVRGVRAPPLPITHQSLLLRGGVSTLIRPLRRRTLRQRALTYSHLSTASFCLF